MESLLTSISTTFAELAVFTVSHRHWFEAMNGVVTLIFGFLMLGLGKRVCREEQWPQYFGWAFVFMGIEYLFLFLAVFENFTLNWSGWGWLLLLYGGRFLIHIMPAVIYLLLLASAFAMIDVRFHQNASVKLGPLGSFFSSQTPSKPGYYLHGLMIVIAVAVIFPDWLYFWTPYHLLLSSLFAAISLLLLAWCMYLNFRADRKWRPAGVLTVVGAILFAIAFIAFGFTPVAVANEWPIISGFLTGIRNMGSHIPPELALNSLITGVLFGLKAGLFLGGFTLLQKQVLISISDKQNPLLAIANGHKEYLSPQGILKHIGEKIGASLVDIWIRIPGSGPDTLLRIGWYPFSVYLDEEAVTTLKTGSIIDYVMKEGYPVTSSNIQKDPFFRDLYHPTSKLMCSLTTMPIYYHGAVIGCINCEWEKRTVITATAETYIQQMALFMATNVQARRQELAISAFGERLGAQWDSIQSTRDCDQIKKILKAMSRDLHQVLNVPAMLIYIDTGFMRIGCFYIEGLQEESGVCQFVEDEGSVKPQLEAYDCRSSELTAPGGPIGRLILGTPKAEEHRRRPILARYTHHRQIVAEMVGGALINGFYRQYECILSKLQMKLNNEVTTVEAWWACLEHAFRAADFIWCFYRPDEGQQMGGTQNLELVPKNLLSKSKEIVLSYQPLLEKNEFITGILRLRLEQRGFVFLGMRHPKFDLALLQTDCPWSQFLKRLSTIAELSYANIMHRELQKKAYHLALENTKIEIPGLLLHDLVNKVRGVTANASVIKGEIYDPAPNSKEVIEKHMAHLLNAAGELSELAVSFSRVFRTDDPPNTRMQDIFLKAEQSYAALAQSREIELTFSPTRDLEANVPFRVLSLVLGNLISNALDAVKYKGFIKVQAEKQERLLLCSVTSSSHIAPEIREKIWDSGFTTRKNGTGLGLPLSRDALRRVAGDLILENPKSNTTTFTMKLPLK